MLKMLKSIYSVVKYCVKCDTELTNYFDCTNGVRQGCVISPILFCYFLNDLKDYVSVDSHGIDLDFCKIFLLLFADDLVMFADTKIELQRLINRLENYCNEFKLKINMDKTNIIVFRNGGYLRSYEKWFFGDIPVKVVTYYKYLGLVLSSRLSWYVCQKTLAEQGSKALFAIRSKLTQFGTLSANLLFKIFDTKVLPILTYGAEIWFNHVSLDSKSTQISTKCFC
ncbi:MAG: reverse transcriptase domain-containing protein [Candidatus Thiodiazotropha sp.]